MGGWVRVRARMYLHQVVRLMFLCRVVEGNSFPATDATLSQAQVDALLANPSSSSSSSASSGGGDGVHYDGYNSVRGLTRTEGGALNWDELVVYQDCAAIPSYLIVYSPGARR